MDDLSEKEQIELMRSWWKENGTYVIVGLLLGVGSIVGITQWRSGQVETQMAASELFEALAEEVAENRLEPAEAIAADMYADHADSVYADQSRLAMARLYMDQGRDQDAADTLRQLVDQGSNPSMQLVGRLRLAKVLLYQGKSEEVIALTEGFTGGGMGARFSEALGDAHFAQGQYAEAEAAYLAALNDPVASQLVDATLLRMKISDLPEMLAEGDTITPTGATGATDETTEMAGDADEAATDEGSADDDSAEAPQEEPIE